MKPLQRQPTRRSQQGATLVVGLIMLVLLTLLALAAVRQSATHLQVVGNEQFRSEATTATHYAIDLVLNNPQFAMPPAPGVAPQAPYAPVLFSARFDDAALDDQALAVTFPQAPECMRFRYLRKSELVQTRVEGTESVDFVAREDATCFRGQSSSGISLVVESSAADEDLSLCVTTLWEFQTQAEDPTSGARMTITQGVEQRMDEIDALARCS